MIELPQQKKYQVILADPPWKYDNINWIKSKKGENKNYPLMELEDIKNLPISDIADKDCYLFLWVTSPFLEKGIEVINAWGFNYVTIAFNWIKQYSNGKDYCGMGRYTRSGSEICLLARKPKANLNTLNYNVYQVIKSNIEKHSKKPDVVRERIVQLFGDVPRIELFARQKVEGWDCWGNEINENTPTQTLLSQPLDKQEGT